MIDSIKTPRTKTNIQKFQGRKVMILLGISPLPAVNGSKVYQEEILQKKLVKTQTGNFQLPVNN